MLAIIIENGSEAKPLFWSSSQLQFCIRYVPHLHRYFSIEEATCHCPVDGIVLQEIDRYTGRKHHATSVKKQYPKFTNLVSVKDKSEWFLFGSLRPMSTNISEIILRCSDWPVSTLIKKYLDGSLIINQTRLRRHECWTIKAKSQLIESLVIGLPIAITLAADLTEPRNFSVVDGNQRLLAILNFFGDAGTPAKFALTGLNLRPDLEGLTAEEVNTLVKNFAERSLRVTTLTDWQNQELLINLRERLNTQN